ncbi:hypothetical protein R1sor_025523 [Riccia sorocarpa]|uniref:Chalcone-flavonone isomerase family protein n=1 Tax=Riccia sorocarpa TaxID=122646 RepID=A0ABD3GBX3_9MARC
MRPESIPLILYYTCSAYFVLYFVDHLVGAVRRETSLQELGTVETRLRAMAATCLTMATVTSMSVCRLPESSSGNAARVSDPAPILPSFQSGRRPQGSGFFGDSWKLQRNSGFVFAEPVVSRSRGAMAVRASVGVENEVTEPVTGIKFSKNETPQGASKDLILAGVGVREKKVAILKVKVYAVGLYVEPSVVSSLEQWKSKGASNLEKDEAFFKALVAAPVEKSLRIVLARDIEGGQFWGALDEALKPRLKSAGAGEEGEKALAAFGDVFKKRPIKERTVIFLTWSQPSTLHISVSAEGASPSAPDATIDSESLLYSLYDVFLGKDSVSPSAKAAIAKGISGAF